MSETLNAVVVKYPGTEQAAKAQDIFKSDGGSASC